RMRRIGYVPQVGVVVAVGDGEQAVVGAEDCLVRVATGCHGGQCGQQCRVPWVADVVDRHGAVVVAYGEQATVVVHGHGFDEPACGAQRRAERPGGGGVAD